MTRTELLL